MRLLSRSRAAFLGASLVAAFALTVTTPASAFCGFYVSGAEAKLYADATQVVLMREGTRTVLSMQNDYKGPPEKFAMVIPVPVVLQKENVKTLPLAVFDKVDKLGSPRLVEYWEQDPCPPPNSGNMWGDGIGAALGAGGLGLSGIGSGGGGRDLGVKVEAKFAIGEYEIVVLSAKDSGGLDTWLREEKYAIPAGAEPYLRPYVQSGMKFFVAKVDPAKVKFENGRAALSPLRFHYDAESFSLPIRLGLINSGGTQDLIVNVLARAQRYEVANYKNVTIPTNLDVTSGARERFGELYAALFDKTVATNKNAVVTEYAWDAGTCDPCPGPTLDANDLATLGADAMPSASGSTGGGGGGLGGLGNLGSSGSGSGGMPSTPRGVPRIQAMPPTVGGRLPPEVIRRITLQNMGRFRFCYEKGLTTNPALQGAMTVKYAIGSDGAVRSVTEADGATLADKEVKSCVANMFRRLSFPAGEGQSVTVAQPMTFAPPDPNAPAAPAAPTIGRGFGGFSSYVLTRLHVRYAKDEMGQDLVFKAASAIAGGREQMNAGVLERGSQPASTNNFQARYAIRHAWTGPIECKEPRRGVWGGPPPSDGGARAGAGPVAAQKTAFAPRGNLALASMLTGAAASEVVGDAGALVSIEAGVSEAGAADAADADAGPASTPPKTGCAGCAVGTSQGSLSGVLAVALAFVSVLRRRRSVP